LSLTKFSLEGNNLIIPGQGKFGYSDIPAGDGEIANLFLQCTDDSTFFANLHKVAESRISHMRVVGLHKILTLKIRKYKYFAVKKGLTCTATVTTCTMYILQFLIPK
jgi:hypothetical protein